MEYVTIRTSSPPFCRIAGPTRTPLRRAAHLQLHPADPDDDYLAADQRAELVSGDGHLLALAGEYPIAGPADFLAAILGTNY